MASVIARIPSDLSGSSSDLSDSSLILKIGPSSEILCIVIGDPPPHLPAISADAYVALLSSMIISHPFWQYSDPYSSPYFMPSQEPAFGPISDLRMPYQTHPHLPTIFAFPVSLWYYSRWHHLHNNYTVRYQHSRSPKASKHPSPLFNLDVQYPDFRLSVAMCNFLFWTNQFS